MRELHGLPVCQVFEGKTYAEL